MALSSDLNVPVFASSELVDLPVDDDVLIVKGGLVGRNSATGYVRPLAAGDDYVGLAYATVDNTQPGHAAGAVNARLWQNVDATFSLGGAQVSDIGRTVYASDDRALTFNAGAGSPVGRIVAVDSPGEVRVRLMPVFSTTRAESFRLVTLGDVSATLGLEHMNKILLMSNTAARTLTLPLVNTVRAGAWFRLIKTSAAAFAITLDGAGTETIEGAATFTGVDAQYDTVLLVCTGSEWVILSRDIA